MSHHRQQIEMTREEAEALHREVTSTGRQPVTSPTSFPRSSAWQGHQRFCEEQQPEPHQRTSRARPRARPRQVDPTNDPLAAPYRTCVETKTVNATPMSTCGSSIHGVGVVSRATTRS
jgi:hypothetical protein